MTKRMAVLKALRARRPLTAKALVDEWTLDAESAAEVEQNGERVRAKLRAAASGKTFVAPRRDLVQDRDIFKQIQACMRAGASVRLVARKGAGVLAWKKTIYSAPRDKFEKALPRERRLHPTPNTWIKSIWVPGWDHTGDRLKALSWAMVLNESPGIAFTIRLGPEVISAGLSFKHGIAAYIRDRLQRRLRERFHALGFPSPDMFVSIEVPRGGELHVHGAVSVPGDRDDHCEEDKAYLQAKAVVRHVLDQVAGNWVGPSGVDRGRKVDTKRLDTPLRWVSYVSKCTLSSERMLDGRALAASNGLRSKARRWYVDARKFGVVIKAGPNWRDHGLVDLDDLEPGS
ncbi:MAG TPA: hypothetical protein VGL58_08455 [Caulobacteraceae bacterium]|jgi:hypothetical protein